MCVLREEKHTNVCFLDDRYTLNVQANQGLHPDILAWETTVSPDIETGSLEKELEFFNQHRREWLRAHSTKFVVIGGTTVAGFHDDYETAFKAGISTFRDKDFLVKQISAEEPVYLIF